MQAINRVKAFTLKILFLAIKYLINITLALTILLLLLDFQFINLIRK